MNKTPFFISTAIDYPSAKVHLGHALEKVQADVIARYKRLQGFEVHFSTGVDQHGLKIQRCAEKVDKSPQEFVDEMSKCFKNAWDVLNISYDDFIQTTEERHKKTVQEIINKIYEKGDIYKGKYKGLYCVDCESYYLPKDLVNGKCPIHHRPLEMIEEESYFFRMSKYQKELLKHIKENKSFIIPESRRNEVLNRLKEPLQDLNISRKTVKWGIPLPFDKEKVLFVWVDALINYLTTINYPEKDFQKFWPADIHVIGKDITWHHSVIWGSLLLSLGLPLPKTILVHGFITADGQKMSKSLGNVIDPFELVEKYGTDAVRYYLLREIPTTKDGDFSYQKFEKRYNDDLASGIGNLVARIIGIAIKLKSEARSPKPEIKEQKIQDIINDTWKKYHKAIEGFKLNEALIAIWDLISFCDKYIEKEKAWEEKENQKEIIDNLLFIIGEIAKMLKPFLPETSEKIIAQLKDKEGILLFPRLE
jgi:methionyl-tRNA synthetase